jgi:cysteine desulfurase
VIYLDSNATSQVHPEVLQAMLPFLSEQFFNPSSGYRAGKAVKLAIETARIQLADLLGARADEIIFTGSGTESNNMALLSLAQHTKGKTIVTGEIEHSAVLRVCEYLEQEQGYEVLKLAVDEGGVYQLDSLHKILQERELAFVSLMLANNETGVIQPIAEACALAHEFGVPFHSDAIQAVGKMKVDVNRLGVDFLSISGHKFHAPKGVGALYIKSGNRIAPLLRGGGQEKGLRSGTENVASIVGLGKAASIMKDLLDMDEHKAVRGLRDELQSLLLETISGVKVNGNQACRAANTLHVSFDGCQAAGLLILLDEYGLACSAGSACMTGKQQASHVQKAMGFSDARANSSLRLSLSIFTTRNEIHQAAEILAKAVKKLRSVQGGSGVGPVTIYSA